MCYAVFICVWPCVYVYAVVFDWYLIRMSVRLSCSHPTMLNVREFPASHFDLPSQIYYNSSLDTFPNFDTTLLDPLNPSKRKPQLNEIFPEPAERTPSIKYFSLRSV